MENNNDYNVNIYYSEEEVLAAFTNYYDEVKRQTKVYVFAKDSAPLSHYAKDSNVELHHSGGLFGKIRTWLSGKAPFHDQLIQLEITSENIEKYKKIIANGGTIIISRADTTATINAEVSAPQETLEDVTNEAISTAILAGTEKQTNREKFASTAITDPEYPTSIASTIEPIELKENGSEILPELISDAANLEEEQLDLPSVPQESAISQTAQQPQDTLLLNNQNNESNTEQANTYKQSFPYNPTEALEHEDDILSHPASIIDDSINASDNLDESQVLNANFEPFDASNEASQVSSLNDLQSIDLQDEPQQEVDISNSSQEVSSNGYETEQNVEDYENGSTEHSLEKENLEQISNAQEDISLTFDDRHPEITSSIAALEEADPDSSDFTNANVLEAAESIEFTSPIENHSDQEKILLLVEENTSELNINSEIIHLNDSLHNKEEASDQLSSESNNTDESIHFTIEGEDEVMSNKESFPHVPEEAKEHPGEILSHIDAYESAQEDLPEAPHPLENLNEEEEAFRVSEEISAENPINATDINAPQFSDEQQISQEIASSEVASTAEPALSETNTPDASEPSLQLDSESQLNADIEVSVSEEFESEKKQLEKNTSYNQEDEEIFQELVEQESNQERRFAPNEMLHRPNGLEDEQTYEAIVEGENSTHLRDEAIGKAAEYRRHDLP
jgi:hypothetical protein